MRHPTRFLASCLLALAACPGGGAHPGPTGPTLSAETPTPTPTPTPAPAAPEMTLAQSGIVPEWLDKKADACQDFFQYACGGFLATAEIPADRSSWGAIAIVVQQQEEFLRDLLEKAAKDPGKDPVLQKIGDYYAACMDEDGIEKAGVAPLAPLQAEIAKVKDLPTAAHAIGELHAVGIFPFFDLSPTQDFADVTQEIASLDQRGLGLPDRKYYLESTGNMKEVRDTYVAHVGRMFTLAGLKPAEVKTAVADVMRIETAIAKLQQDRVFRRDPHNIYHRVELAGLKKAAPQFPWDAYLERMDLRGVTAITVNDPAYFTGVVKLIGKEKPEALRHYLTWMLLHGSAKHLSKAFVDEDFTLDSAITGTKALPPRWRRCVQRVDQDLGELLGQPYVAVKFAGNAKQSAIDLTKAVFDAMDAELGTLPWMDDATRAAAKQKLVKMAYLVGYPDKWRVYDFDVSRTDYAGNVLAATRFELKRQMAKIGKPVDRFDWLMTPPTVNAYYEPTLNELALPAGQLQPPFFGASFHPAVNFGSTAGGTIGHEMTHGFDDEGSQFDADGNLKEWWSASTKKAFAEATQCVVDQYAQYEAVPGVKLDGKLTAGENIADIGGVKIAFFAYHAWRAKQKTAPPAMVEGYSDDQLYFLAYAQSWCAKVTPESAETRAHTDPHSPPKWRVNGVIVDQPGFAEAFKCQKGTPMNPGKTCAVW
jgi:predicted metalloendopeptidase